MSQTKADGVLKDWYCVSYYQEHEGQWTIIYRYAYGTVVIDHKKRFATGSIIRTSHVQRIEANLAYTQNSIYELVDEGAHYYLPAQFRFAIESLGLHPKQCTFKVDEPSRKKKH